MSAEIQTTTADPVEAGRAALARAAWEEARAFFEAAVSQAETAEALEGLGWAAWWLNDAQVMFDARQRAYRLYRLQGERRAAARMATWLGTDHVDFRGEVAVAQGWLRRARRLLEGLEPGSEHGWLSVHEAEKHLFANDTARARELGTRASELGRSLGIVDLEMMGLATEGLSLVTEAEVEEGMSRLDEAAAAAFGGEFGEIWPTVWCGCYVLYACERTRDYDRAAQWCRSIEAWSERMRIPFLNRICRAQYAGVLIWRGTWGEAEEMLSESRERLAAIRPPMAAEAAVRLGELRRRQGRLDEAAEIFEQVAAHPLALLGLGEVHLDQGELAGARDRAEQYLREAPPHTATVRAPGLELLVRAHTALGEGEKAVAALHELQTIARLVSTDPLRASARFSQGLVASAAGDREGARTAFEDAARLFQRSGAPFEAARARVELARVLAGLERGKEAVTEARAAAVSLRRIGAEHEAARAEAIALEVKARRPSHASLLTRRECEVLRLVADGRSDRAIAELLVLSEHTVHRHVANILAKLGCASRSAAVAEAIRKELI